MKPKEGVKYCNDKAGTDARESLHHHLPLFRKSRSGNFSEPARRNESTLSILVGAHTSASTKPDTVPEVDPRGSVRLLVTEIIDLIDRRNHEFPHHGTTKPIGSQPLRAD
jgi:hypothetical protein